MESKLKKYLLNVFLTVKWVLKLQRWDKKDAYYLKERKSHIVVLRCYIQNVTIPENLESWSSTRSPGEDDENTKSMLMNSALAAKCIS